MKASLKQLGYDPATGEFDVDRAEGLTTASERSNIRALMEIITKLSEIKKEVKKEEIIEAASRQNIKNAEEIIEKLKKEGMLFEPNAGYVQKV
jgi:replicative DNA helicase Mcm